MKRKKNACSSGNKSTSGGSEDREDMKADAAASSAAPRSCCEDDDDWAPWPALDMLTCIDEDKEEEKAEWAWWPTAVVAGRTRGDGAGDERTEERGEASSACWCDQ